MEENKNIIQVLTETLATVSERALKAETALEATTTEKDQWYGWYVDKKAELEKAQAEIAKLQTEKEGLAKDLEWANDDLNSARAIINELNQPKQGGQCND